MSPERGSPLLAPLTALATERHVERSPSPDVCSQRRLLERLRGALDARPAASPALLQLLAQRAVAGAPGEASRVGLGPAADATIAGLRRAGTTADDLDATATARGRLLARALRDLDARLEQLGKVDARRSLARVDLARLRGVPLPAAVALSGVVGLDGAQREAWLTLHAAIRARGGRGVSLRLPRLAGPAEEPLARVAEALEALLAEEPEAFELEWLELERAGSAQVVEAQGDAAEARAVASEVRAALDRGARPDRVLVVVPGRDEAFLSPLRAALREALVPFSEAWGPPVEASPEARGLLSLVSMVAGRLDKDALIELLRTPGLHPGSLVGLKDEGEAARKAAHLAARLATLPISQDRSGALFVGAMRDAIEQDGSHGDFWMIAAMERLVATLSELRAAPTVAALLEGLLGTLDRLRLGDPSASELRHALGAEESALWAIGEGAVAVRAAREALAALRDAHRELGSQLEHAQPAELAAELAHTLARARTAARGAAARAGAVRVGELREAPALDHDLIVVTRLTARGYAPDPGVTLLDEATRRRLPPARRPRGTRERAQARDAELGWALASARALVLTYSSIDGEGRDAGPAHPQVQAALAEGAAARREPASRLAAGASRLSPRGAELSRLSLGEAPASDLGPRVHIERERAAFFADPGARPSAFTGRVPEALAPALVERLGGDTPERTMPVTAIERALACPFRAFAERVLRARRREEGSDLLAPRERGDLLHRALHAAFEANRELPPSATREARVEAARAAVERALSLEAFAAPLRRVERARAALDALALFGDELDAPGAIPFFAAELRFGPHEPEGRGPLELRASDGTAVYVEGRIDRLDVTSDRRRLRVVDYKTGSYAKSPGEHDLQLPLYALAARRLLATEEPEAELSAVYITVAPGGLAAVRPAREAAQTLDAHALVAAERLAADTVARLWRGLVPARPARGDLCRSCDARGLCRRPAVMPDGDPAEEEEGG